MSSVISRPVKAFTVIKRRKMEILRGDKVAARDGYISNANTYRINRDNAETGYRATLATWQGTVNQYRLDVAAWEQAIIAERVNYDLYVGPAGSPQNWDGYWLWRSWFFESPTTSPRRTQGYMPTLEGLTISYAGLAGLNYLRWVINVMGGTATDTQTNNAGHLFGWIVTMYPQDYQHWQLPTPLPAPAEPSAAPARPSTIDYWNSKMITALNSAAAQDVLIAKDNAYINKLDIMGGAEEVIDATASEHNKVFLDAIERQINSVQGQGE